MDRRRAGSPVQHSGGSSSTGSSYSPGMPPVHNRSASVSGLSNIRKTQNLAAKAANARLARVMDSKAAGEDDEGEDDEDVYADFAVPSLLGRNIVENVPVRSSSTGRPSIINRLTHASSSASLSTPSVSTPAPLVPSSRVPLRTPTPILAIEPPFEKQRDKRFSADRGYMTFRESGSRLEASALQDQAENPCFGDVWMRWCSPPSVVFCALENVTFDSGGAALKYLTVRCLQPALMLDAENVFRL